jgi:hypothetical protein
MLLLLLLLLLLSSDRMNAACMPYGLKLRRWQSDCLALHLINGLNLRRPSDKQQPVRPCIVTLSVTNTLCFVAHLRACLHAVCVPYMYMIAFMR